MTKAEIQLVRSLTDKRSRTEHGLFVAEGHKFIGELRTSAPVSYTHLTLPTTPYV